MKANLQKKDGNKKFNGIKDKNQDLVISSKLKIKSWKLIMLLI